MKMQDIFKKPIKMGKGILFRDGVGRIFPEPLRDKLINIFAYLTGINDTLAIECIERLKNNAYDVVQCSYRRVRAYRAMIPVRNRWHVEVLVIPSCKAIHIEMVPKYEQCGEFKTKCIWAYKDKLFYVNSYMDEQVLEKSLWPGNDRALTLDVLMPILMKKTKTYDI